MLRRRFLLIVTAVAGTLCPSPAASATPSTPAVPSCSFCGVGLGCAPPMVHVPAEVGDAGLGICSMCALTCWDILQEGLVMRGPARSASRDLEGVLSYLHHLSNGGACPLDPEWVRASRQSVPHEWRGDPRCSFCNAREREVGHLLRGPAIDICDTCACECVVVVERLRILSGQRMRGDYVMDLPPQTQCRPGWRATRWMARAAARRRTSGGG